MNEKEKSGYGSRLGLVCVLIGASVGTGNVWRFPRMAAVNGGGAFVLAMVIVLFLMAVPIVCMENVMGRATRHGTPGAFRDFIGKKYTWMGTFASMAALMMLSYYMAVMAWCVRYAGLSITKSYWGKDMAEVYDSVVNGSVATWVVFAVLCLLLYACVYKSQAAIEKVATFMVPVLALLLIIIAGRALMLPGALEGVKYVFTIQPKHLFAAQTWLNALTQAAWSIGPGLMIMLNIAVYSSRKSDISLNTRIQAFGDMSIALVSTLGVIPTIFAMMSVSDAVAACESSNSGLTFLALTSLFQQIGGGYIISIMFFLALAFAAFSTATVQCMIGTQMFIDAGWSRKKSAAVTVGFLFIVGTPSALNEWFLLNQDMVWACLMLFGSIFLGFAAHKYGAEKIRTRLLNFEGNEIQEKRYWSTLTVWVAPIVITLVFVWWIWQAIGWYPNNWWSPFEQNSPGTIISQGLVLFIICWALNNKMADSIKYKYFDGENYPELPDELR